MRTFALRARQGRKLINSPISGVPVIGYRIQFSELGFFGRVKDSFAVRRALTFAIAVGESQLEVAPAAHAYLYLSHEYRGRPEQMGSVANAAYQLHGTARHPLIIADYDRTTLLAKIDEPSLRRAT